MGTLEEGRAVLNLSQPAVWGPGRAIDPARVQRRDHSLPGLTACAWLRPPGTSGAIDLDTCLQRSHSLTGNEDFSAKPHV